MKKRSINGLFNDTKTHKIIEVQNEVNGARHHYEVVGVNTCVTYYKFFEITNEVIDSLNELGFSKIQKKRKGWLEMLKECREQPFCWTMDNYSVACSIYNGQYRVAIHKNTETKLPLKYISYDDASRIVKECKENNIGDIYEAE